MIILSIILAIVLAVLCIIKYFFEYLYPRPMYIEQINDDLSLELIESIRIDGLLQHIGRKIGSSRSYNKTQLFNNIILFDELQSLYGKNGGIRIRYCPTSKHIFADIYTPLDYKIEGIWITVKNKQKQKLIYIKEKCLSYKAMFIKFVKKCLWKRMN